MMSPWLPVAAALAAAQGRAVPEPVVVVEDRLDVVERLGGNRVERARTVTLERQALEAAPAETLPEALALAGGTVVLFPHPFGGAPIVVSRGFFGGGETDYLTLDLGGLPLADLDTGSIDWQSVRLADVERIELLAGPASRAAGELALAGAVSVEPRATGAGGGAGVELSAAGFGTRSASARWSGPLSSAAAAWSGTLAADAFETDGYRDHSAADGHGALARLERAGAAGSLDFAALGRSRQREEPGPLAEDELLADRLGSNPLFASDLEISDRWAAAVGWRDARAPVELRLEGDGRRAGYRRTLLLAPGFGDTAHRSVDARGWTLAARTAEEIALGERLGWGAAVEARDERAELEYLDGAATAPLAADAARRERWSAELRAAWRPSRRLELAATARGDRIADRSRLAGDREHRAFSPRLALLFRPDPGARAPVELFGEVARAFRPPTLDQRFDPRPLRDPSGGTFTVSNPELEPQRSRGWELGAGRRGEAASWRLLGYRMSLADEIDFDPATFRYGNIGRSRHEGVEAQASWRASRAGTLEVAAAWSRAFAEGARRSGQLKNIPERLVRAGWSAELPAGVAVAVHATALLDRWADDANTRSLGDAWLADLRVARGFGSVRARLDLLNLLDEDALELGFLLPGFDGREVLHGYARAPRTARLGLEWSR